MRTGDLEGRTVARWPAPVVDAIEETVVDKANTYSAWGHRKIWEMLRRDGTDVSQSSVKRALARRGLLQPVRYQAERREFAKARRAAFVEPPRRRDRVWQTDFSEFETSAGGTWQITGVVDYAAKVCLACHANGTQMGRDAVSVVEAAIHEAERLLGHSLKDDLVDPDSGELSTLVVVTDDGPAYKSDAFAHFILSRPELSHVRTRHRSPQTTVSSKDSSKRSNTRYRHDIDNA